MYHLILWLCGIEGYNEGRKSNQSHHHCKRYKTFRKGLAPAILATLEATRHSAAHNHTAAQLVEVANMPSKCEDLACAARFVQRAFRSTIVREDSKCWTFIGPPPIGGKAETQVSIWSQRNLMIVRYGAHAWVTSPACYLEATGNLSLVAGSDSCGLLTWPLASLAKPFDTLFREKMLSVAREAAACVETVGCTMIARCMHQAWLKGFVLWIERGSPTISLILARQVA